VWAAWVNAFAPNAYSLSPSSLVVSNSLVVSDSLYSSEASLSTFDNALVPFVIGAKDGIFQHVQNQLKAAVRLPGEYAIAWSSSIGRTIICAWPSGENK